jgi:hypothetical protein
VRELQLEKTYKDARRIYKNIRRWISMDGKALLASKQTWLMILTVIVSIVASPDVINAVPWIAVYGATIIAVLSIVIRAMTDQPITGVIRA